MIGYHGKQWTILNQKTIKQEDTCLSSFAKCSTLCLCFWRSLTYKNWIWYLNFLLEIKKRTNFSDRIVTSTSGTPISLSSLLQSSLCCCVTCKGIKAMYHKSTHTQLTTYVGFSGKQRQNQASHRTGQKDRIVRKWSKQRQTFTVLLLNFSMSSLFWDCRQLIQSSLSLFVLFVSACLCECAWERERERCLYRNGYCQVLRGICPLQKTAQRLN